ncbi:hypothetical protein AB0M91_15135 [Micromonospora rifamycinica]|uniref:hypothetical protein n=1 Tax=Micromonospora rifamycinica TaxID=291594 RepID=UPI0034236BFF
MNPKPDDEEPRAEKFDWTKARWGALYPPTEIVAEMGRVTIAAARVDRQLALVLLALKYPEDFETLLRRESSKLYKAVDRRVREFFEGPLLEWTLVNLEEVKARIEARHAVAHSIWTVGDRSEMISVEILVNLRSQEELDQLLIERGELAEWKTLHPRKNAPGPQSVEELQKIRTGLEGAADWLERLRFTLASALFAGKPEGARKVLDPRSFDSSD